MTGRAEYGNYRELEQKLAGLLAENDLIYAIDTNDPITITIASSSEDTERISMLETQDNGIFGRGAKVVFVFENGEVSVRTTGKAILPEKTLDKIKGLVKKIHYAYLQWFFLDTTSQWGTAMQRAEEALRKRITPIYDVSCGTICLLEPGTEELA